LSRMERVKTVKTEDAGLESYTAIVAGVLGVLTSAWIPTLGILFGALAVIFGSINLRGATGRRRALAIAAIVLGLLAPLIFVVIIVLSGSSPTSGNAGGNV
jgi:hypothetical protein